MIMIVENQIFRFTEGRFFDGKWEHSKMEGPGKMSYVFPSSFLPKCDTIREAKQIIKNIECSIFHLIFNRVNAI